MSTTDTTSSVLPTNPSTAHSDEELLSVLNHSDQQYHDGMARDIKYTIVEARNKQGFTLAELLIVVAIIAVLAAISIPVFSDQLEKSRDATSIANIRSAYAMAQTEYMTCDIKDSQTDNNVHGHQIKNSDGKEYMSVNFKNGEIYQIVVLGVEIKSQKRNAWSHLGDKLPFVGKWVYDNDNGNNGDIGKPGKYRLVFTYDSNGNIVSVQFLYINSDQ